MSVRRTTIIAVVIALGLAVLAAGQEVIDRIVARVDNDVILWSDMQDLARYQILVDGKAQSDSEILDHLIDQYIVRNEAKASFFPQPSEQDVRRSLDRLKKSFASPEEFTEREKQAGLTDDGVLRILTSQLYLSNYLDSRFRASIQVNESAIEDYYKTRVVPRAESRDRTPPTLEAATPYIKEVLVQRAINVQADRWLKESRNRLQIQYFPDESSK
jgi:parvulin-like peptidyl-prolyl isomerase